MRRILKILRNLFLFFLLSSFGVVFLYRWVPVWFTPLMGIRAATELLDGRRPAVHHRWVPLSKISKWLPQAVVASEDNLFLSHHGFDFDAIRDAVEEQERGRRLRGASTITQQTAKNVFLWPGRSFVRKGLEAYFTVLIEMLWSKERIMEVYLNSIETGKNIYGAEAVAQAHFHKKAAALSRSECALIAASLPNPVRYDSGRPSAYLLRRRQQILSLMEKIGPVGFE